MKREFLRNVFASLVVEIIVLSVSLIFDNDVERLGVLIGGTFLFLISAYLSETEIFWSVFAGVLIVLVGYWTWASGLVDSLVEGFGIYNPQGFAEVEQLSSNYEQIDISILSELDAPIENMGLPPGLQTLSGIDFENGWTTSTECSHLPDQPEVLVFDTSTRNSRYVYFVLQAGYGILQYEQEVIGYVNLWFEDGSRVQEYLTLGENIRDWNWRNPEAVSSITSIDIIPGWESSNSEGIYGGMDILALKVPVEKQDLILTRIELGDLSRANTGGINPCIHLMGLTIEVNE